MVGCSSEGGMEEAGEYILFTQLAHQAATENRIGKNAELQDP